jgi:hypothetical protein
MKARKTLLNRLLQTLVDEWGRERVADALVGIRASSNGPSAEGPPTAKFRPSGKASRPSATEQIERSAFEGARKDALLQLAVRYDNKQFLPSVADVREFLIMMGERPNDMKDRKGAFRILLRNLTQLPVERLQELASTALHSGPSQLGPLSDAIAAAAERLPRQRQSNSD